MHAGLINFLAASGFATIFMLAMTLFVKLEQEKKLRSEINKLKISLDEMDEQAKLIVRTDMELNKTQEALDNKVTSLYALQKLSRSITTTLQENQIFRLMEPSSLLELGFEKSCAFIWHEEKSEFIPHLSIGYLHDDVQAIKETLNKEKERYLAFIKHGQTISSISEAAAQDFKLGLNELFDVTYFILSPILPKEGDKGFLFVGTLNEEMQVTEGDEELITILANQLGTALDNARLFEKTWHAQQELENKVEERTQALSAALEEVREISKRKSDFVSSVSHELRTPLTAIKGYAAILIGGNLGQVPEQVKQRLEKINLRSDELVQFVNDLLDISRIESGKVTMTLERCDLNKITGEIADLLAVLMKEKQVDFSVNIPPGLSVLADLNQIKRVFINLVNNALKYTPAGGRISIQARKIDHEVQTDVVDTGCGIPEEALGKLFQEFYRVDSPINQQVKGTGLGLTLTKKIIDAHSGKIWVKSKVGGGSSFSFTLPLAG